MGRCGLCALIVVGIACQGKNDDTAKPRPTTPSDATIEQRAEQRLPTTNTPVVRPAVIDAPMLELPKRESIRLVAPGAGARSTLRYGKLAADTTRGETALTSRDLVDGVWSQPSKLPAIRDGFAITPLAGTAQQLAVRPLTAEIVGASTPAADAYVQGWRTNLQERRATIAVDDRGTLGAFGFNDDPGDKRMPLARDELAQRLLALIVPLPAEAIGIGATWEVVTILRQARIFMKQTATYKLVARDAKKWTVEVAIKRVAETQRIEPQVDLVAMFREFTGTLEVTPDRLIGTGKLAVESRVHVRLLGRVPEVDKFAEDLGSITLTRSE